jgi:beta-lactamase regulating signal transducer with metallopeptidase domain
MNALEHLDAVIHWLLWNSAGAAVVVLLVLAVQGVLRNRISARWRYNLWLLVVVRLLLPAMPGLRVSIPRWARVEPALFRMAAVSSPVASSPAASPIQAGDIQTIALPPDIQIVEIGGHAAAGRRRSSPAAVATPSPHQATPPQSLSHREFDWKLAGIAIWLAGAGVLLLRIAWLNLRLTLRVRHCTPVCDSDLNEMVLACCRSAGVGRPPRLFWGPSDSGPALVGMWTPKLLLPECVRDFFPNDVRVILLHELAHLKRHDVAVNDLIAVLHAFHWFNPLLWMAFSRMKADRELACDEAVLRLTPLRERRAYGCTILKLLEILGRGQLPAGAMGVVGNKALMHRRISMIAKFDANKRSWSPTGLVLSLMLIGAAGVSAVRAQQAPPAATPRQPGDPTVEQARQAVNAAAGVAPAATQEPMPVAPPAVEAAPPPTTAAPPPVAGVLPAPQKPVAITAEPSPALGMPGMPFISNGTPAALQLALSDGAIFSVEDASASAANAKTADKLKRPQSLEFEGVSLRDALANMAEVGEVDIVIDDNALRTGGVDSSQSPLTMMVREPRPLEQELQLALRLVNPDLDYSLVHGVVLVSTRAELARHVVTRAYGVSPGSDRAELNNLIQSTLGANQGVRLAYVGDRLLVTAPEPAQRQLARLLALVGDQPSEHRIGDKLNPAGPHTSVHTLKYSNAQALASAVTSACPPSVRVTADPRTNSLIITAPTQDQKLAEELILRLDQPGQNFQLDELPAWSNDSLRKMRDLAQEAVALSNKFGPNHPELASVARQIDLIGQQLASLGDELSKKGLDAQAAKLRAEMDQIKAILAPLTAEPKPTAPAAAR